MRTPRMTVVTEGAAPPVVLCLAGTMTSPQVFDEVGEFVPAELVPFDWLRTAGPWGIRYLAERVAALIPTLGGKRPVVVAGHSTGGTIALGAALLAPDLVAGLVLSGTGANTRGHGDIDALVDRVRDDWGESLAEAVIARSFHLPPPPALLAALRAYGREVSQQAVLDVLTSQRSTDLEPDLAAVRVPVAVVHGRHDRARPLEHAARLVQALPDAELTVLDTGHTPMAEDPQGYARALTALLARTGASVR